MFKRKALSAVLSLALVMAPLTGAFSASAQAAYQENLSVVSGHEYFVKNVESGKYLTVDEKDNVIVTANHASAARFKLDFRGDKGYQLLNSNGSLAVTAASLASGANIEMQKNTGSDNQYWNSVFASPEYMMASSSRPDLWFSFNADENLYLGMNYQCWVFEEAPTADTLTMGVYTIYNTRYNVYLGGDPNPTNKVILTSTPTYWTVLPDGNATYRIIRTNSGLDNNNLNALYPGSEVTLSNTWAYNRIIHVSGDTYRVVVSAVSLAVMGVEADASGALKAVGSQFAPDYNDYAGDWVFTYVRPVN
ncbi:MAG: ricin-type beta-trefoil lectin domain protein [Clostridiales bacterium]|nr:ricin-type beta-trefoil lectin domain protein [Clostridiales bacterium]